MGANSAETLRFLPVQQAIGTIGANGIGISAKTDPPEAVAGVRRSAAPRFLHVWVDALPADPTAAFEERSAIAKTEGGLRREAAERLAWDEVNAGPIGDTPQAWRAWMNYRIRAWMARGLLRAKAMCSVWSEAESIWHCRYGDAPNPDRCAGCGEWMLDGPGVRLPDGAVVHLGNPDRLNCLIVYGETWRAAASAGLVAHGLRKPE
jgi:hypothetical protein